MKIFLLVGVLFSIMALVYSTPLPVAPQGSAEHTFTPESRSDSSHEHQQTLDALDQVITSPTPSELDIRSIGDKVASPPLGLDGTLNTGESTSGKDGIPSVLIGTLNTGESTSGKDGTLSVPIDQLGTGENTPALSARSRLAGAASRDATPDVTKVIPPPGGFSIISGQVETLSEDAQQTATQHTDNEQHANEEETSSEQHETVAQILLDESKKIDYERDSLLARLGHQQKPLEGVRDFSARAIDRMRGLMF